MAAVRGAVRPSIVCRPFVIISSVSTPNSQPTSLFIMSSLGLAAMCLHSKRGSISNKLILDVHGNMTLKVDELF